jgi:hypothetical protein
MADKMGRGNEKYIQNLVGKHEGKRQLGRSRRRWEVHIKMDLGKIKVEGCLSAVNGGEL